MDAWSSTNAFSNGTQRPNSTYSGPDIEQTVFNVEVGYNFTLSEIEEVANAAGVQVNPEFLATLPCWYIMWC
jgi:hypothetical protein